MRNYLKNKDQRIVSNYYFNHMKNRYIKNKQKTIYRKKPKKMRERENNEQHNSLESTTTLNSQEQRTKGADIGDYKSFKKVMMKGSSDTYHEGYT